ncbi:hypothetical protein SF23_01105 [Streptomyces sp. MBRL 10]|nr:hypothetical protein SF23_01105 [Streptomyces sp. MBRL 10]
MEGRPFHEPTQELSFVRNLTQGRFAAVLVPTAISGVQRWQLFAHNDATGRVDSFSVEQGAQGLFNTRGTRFYTSPDPLYRDAVFERSPGNCPFTGRELVPVTGTEGRAETALRLNGTDAHLDLGDPAALRFGGRAYSIEAWVKPASYDGPVLARSGEYLLAVDAAGLVSLTHQARRRRSCPPSRYRRTPTPTSPPPSTAPPRSCTSTAGRPAAGRCRSPRPPV